MKNIFTHLMFLFLAFYPLYSYSQITITDVKKIELQAYDKPVPYDSLQTWKPVNKLLDYKQYIGLDVYLLPFENPEIGDSNLNSRFYKPFLFNTEPFLMTVDTTIQKLKINYSITTRDGKYGSSRETPSLKTIKKIKTLVYNPYYYNGYLKHNDFAVNVTNNNKVGNNYYTIVDVLYGSKLTEIKNKIENEFYEDKKNNKEIIIDRNSYEEFSENNRPDDRLFVLTNKKSNDTIYTRENDKFILVPYFVKLQKLYKGKQFIYDDINKYNNTKEKDSIKLEDNRFDIKYENDLGETETKGKSIIVKSGSKWLCADVTLLKPNYKINYILTNDKNEQIALTELKRFILFDEYNKREQNKKLKSQELIAKKNIEKQKENEIEIRKAEKRKTLFITKYGQGIGLLIAKNKVKIGMSKQMCEDAWGIPYRSRKMITENLTQEEWFYGSGYSLLFKNDELTTINQ